MVRAERNGPVSSDVIVCQDQALQRPPSCSSHGEVGVGCGATVSADAIATQVQALQRQERGGVGAERGGDTLRK
jgi:hypothetical protein